MGGSTMPDTIFNNTEPNTICHTCGSNTPLPGKLMCLPCTLDFTPARELYKFGGSLRTKDIARFYRWKLEEAHGKDPL